MIYVPNISWETKIQDVSLSSTGAHYYECTLPVKNLNDKGAGTLNTGLYLVDYLGYLYKIVDIIDSGTNTVEVYDINEGQQYSEASFKAPYQDMIGFVSELTGGHIGLSVSQIRRLHDSARDTINYMDNIISWYHSQFNSTGIAADKPTFTDNGDGTVTVGTADVRLFTTPDFTGSIYEYTIPEATLSFTDAETNFVYAAYDSGSPKYKIGTGQTVISESDEVPIYTFYAENNTVQRQLDWDHLANGLVNRLHKKDIFIYRFEREKGLNISEFGTRNVSISSGYIWQGAQRIGIEAFDSTVDTWCFYYYDGATWQRDDTTTQYNNTQYNPTTGLATLNNNRYTIVWVYRAIENNTVKAACYIMHDEQYNKLTDAQEAQPRGDVPDIIKFHSILVGRIIIEKGEDTGIVQSAFDIPFTISGVSSHNNLTDLYGSADLYHVSESVYNALHDTNAQLTALHTDGTPTFDSLTLNNGIQIGDSTSNVSGTIRWTGSDFEGYDGSSWVSFTSGGSANTVPEVNQTSHGFDGHFIYFNGTNWVKAQANSADTCATHFAVKIDDDNFYLYQTGLIDSSSLTDDISSSLVAGEYYFLSQDTAGKVTGTKPESDIIQSVLIEYNGQATIAIEEPYDLTDLGGSSGSADGVVNLISFDSASGDLTLDRTEGLASISTNLDGRYATDNTQLSQEEVQDYAAPLINHTNHTNISTSYNDSSNQVVMDVPNDLTVLSNHNISELSNFPSLTADKWLKVNSAGDAIELTDAPSGSGSPGGTDGQVQYNNGGSFGGTGLVWDDSLNTFGYNVSAEDTTLFKIKSTETYDGWPAFDWIKFGADTGGGDYADQFSIGKDNLGILLKTYSWAGYADFQVESYSDIRLKSTTGYGTQQVFTVGDNYMTLDNTLQFVDSSTYNSNPFEGYIMRLKNHSSDPDGLYYYNGNQWYNLVNNYHNSIDDLFEPTEDEVFSAFSSLLSVNESIPVSGSFKHDTYGNNCIVSKVKRVTTDKVRFFWMSDSMVGSYDATSGSSNIFVNRLNIAW